MGWAAVVVLGFVLEAGVVIWLARSNTARWERDHRAARAVIQARKEASLRVRAAGLVAQRVPPGMRRLPHPHLSHIPHVHLPPRVVERLAHTRGALRRPYLHLPRQRVRPDAAVPTRDEDSPTGSPS
ncbi:MAG TPA: hypothetical protein VEZ18_19810 [Geodermatophilus sp.]|jgi:hypothetical protein|nr:hypothetical protein [Geodermatophilus sp.]